MSLFLQNNFQNLDGTFVLNNITGVVPMGSEVPGRIRSAPSVIIYLSLCLGLLVMIVMALLCGASRYYRDNKVDYESGFLTPASTGLSPFDPDYHTPLGKVTTHYHHHTPPS